MNNFFCILKIQTFLKMWKGKVCLRVQTYHKSTVENLNFFFESYKNVLFSKSILVFFLIIHSEKAQSFKKEECVPCIREGGFMGLNLGYCFGSVKNASLQGMGNDLSAIDIEIPKGPMGVGYIYPDQIQSKFYQNGFIVGIETGYDFKISGSSGNGLILGYFANGSLSTTKGAASFPGMYQYPDRENFVFPTMSFEEKLRVRNKGFWSTGLRIGPMIKRTFIYVKAGFMMTRTGISLERNELTRIVVPSKVYWFPGSVLGIGTEVQLSPVFVMGIDISASLCKAKQTTVAFPDLGGGMLIKFRPMYTQILFTFKYKFPLKTYLSAPSSVSSVYRPSW
ncbi:hypothetical protein P618_200001 [Holospora obtusa F1]|uniref:Uncharacterized protein n=1 Tax=Holospora obtusa F1 TaxID=1399147 RepID=W6TFJ7_HOLOB|nr:hypothetical protein [Holospora obtusa]ETZ07784.1 hypothetical protein P618_200001 [Holospora obtusa F1]